MRFYLKRKRRLKGIAQCQCSHPVYRRTSVQFPGWKGKKGVRKGMGVERKDDVPQTEGISAVINFSTENSYIFKLAC